MTTLRQAIVSFLAAPEPPPGKGAEFGKGATVGLLVLVLLGIAVWLLLRNMSKHLQKARLAQEQQRAAQVAELAAAVKSARASGELAQPAAAVDGTAAADGTFATDGTGASADSEEPEGPPQR